MIASSDVALTASLIGSFTSARISYFTSRKRTSSPRCSQRTTRSPTGSPPKLWPACVCSSCVTQSISLPSSSVGNLEKHLVVDPMDEKQTRAKSSPPW